MRRKKDRKTLSEISRLLTDWFTVRQRALPWRETRDPYLIWVSEVMLQQTQVKTVIPYYIRFTKRYPGVTDLANAERDELMKHWEGLGYYRRVWNMAETARCLVERHAGKLPSSKAELMRLKGVGDYTSSAVASIAFGENCLAVDGNVVRVVSRLFGIKDDVTKAETKRRIAECGGSLLPDGQAGVFNQALMELGALVCKKSRPSCDVCCVSGFCDAYKLNLTDRIPCKPKKAETPHYAIAVGVVAKKGKILIGLRKPDGLLGNLWEFPGGKRAPGESLADCCRREILEETGLTVCVGSRLAVVKHAYTHFEITLHAFCCEYVSGEAKAKSAVELKWVRPKELDGYAFPKANHPVLKILKNTMS